MPQKINTKIDIKIDTQIYIKIDTKMYDRNLTKNFIQNLTKNGQKWTDNGVKKKRLRFSRKHKLPTGLSFKCIPKSKSLTLRCTRNSDKFMTRVPIILTPFINNICALPNKKEVKSQSGQSSAGSSNCMLSMSPPVAEILRAAARPVIAFLFKSPSRFS